MKVCLALGKLKMSRLTHFTFYHDFKIVKLSPVGRQIFKVTILLCTKWPFYLETKKSIRFTISQRIGILAIEEKNVAQCGKSEIFASQIFREINADKSSVSKTAILTILELFKISRKIYLSGGKILEVLHCVCM